MTTRGLWSATTDVPSPPTIGPSRLGRCCLGRRHPRHGPMRSLPTPGIGSQSHPESTLSPATLSSGRGTIRPSWERTTTMTTTMSASSSRLSRPVPQASASAPPPGTNTGGGGVRGTCRWGLLPASGETIRIHGDAVGASSSSSSSWKISPPIHAQRRPHHS
jgi:hypothetical protein